MSAIQKSVVTLRICGDDLAPQNITDMLGVPPTYAQIKGEEIVGQKTGRVRVAKSGLWNLCASDRQPEDIDGQIREIFEMTSAEITVWQSITNKYEADLFCGLFMSKTNDGLTLSVQSLATLAERGIELWFDIYAPDDDDEQSAQQA
jgi:hypothetical protein